VKLGSERIGGAGGAIGPEGTKAVVVGPLGAVVLVVDVEVEVEEVVVVEAS